jgi:hypothetical protein
MGALTLEIANTKLHNEDLCTREVELTSIKWLTREVDLWHDKH